jgi:hypothetical protein
MDHIEQKPQAVEGMIARLDDQLKVATNTKLRDILIRLLARERESASQMTSR